MKHRCENPSTDGHITRLFFFFLMDYMNPREPPVTDLYLLFVSSLNVSGHMLPLCA